jgi:hypothetical protein
MPANTPKEVIEALTKRTQDGGTEVVEAKAGKVRLRTTGQLAFVSSAAPIWCAVDTQPTCTSGRHTLNWTQLCLADGVCR